MAVRRSLVIGAGLALGVALLLAGPLALLWNEFRPQPWDFRTVRVHFESARYETAALIFAYRIENHSHYALRLLPEVTHISLRQAPDRPAPGYPSVELPFDLPAHASQTIEIRLDLRLRDLGRAESPSNRIFQFDPPAETPDLTPIPSHDEAAAAPPQPSDSVLDTALRDLDGFELVNESKRVHIVFPRGW